VCNRPPRAALQRPASFSLSFLRPRGLHGAGSSRGPGASAGKVLAPRWARLFGDRKYVPLKVGKVPLLAHDDVIKDRYAENVAGVHEALRHSVVFERRRRRAV